MRKSSGIKVLIGPSSFAAADNKPMEMLLAEGFEVVDNPFKRKLTREELVELLPGVQGLIAGLETLDRKVLENSDLRVISRCGSGLTNVDLDAVKQLGIKFFSTPDAPVTAVAELTLGVLLSLLRHVPQMNESLHRGGWQKRIGGQLNGRSAAVIGYGKIGRRVARLLKAFGVKVAAVDPAIEGPVDGTPLVRLEHALASADIVTLHCSGDKAIIGEKEFDMMKTGTVLLNAARGGLVEEIALKAALDSGKISAAWLDTFSCEPYTGPLCGYPNVILTPHAGSYTTECREEMEMESVTNLIHGLRQGQNS